MWRGRCQCGACDFTIRRETLAVYACHCLECQRQSASAFALSAPVRRAEFVISGPTLAWSRPADSGAITDCHFCRDCGVRLFHASRLTTDWVTVKAGLIEAAGTISPAAHIWVSRKAAWVTLPPDAERFETQPDDLAAWRLALAG